PNLKLYDRRYHVRSTANRYDPRNERSAFVCSKEICWRRLLNHGCEPGLRATLARRWLRRELCYDEIRCRCNKSSRSCICALHRPGSKPPAPTKLLQRQRERSSALRSPHIEESVQSRDIAHAARVVQRTDFRWCLLVALSGQAEAPTIKSTIGDQADVKRSNRAFPLAIVYPAQLMNDPIRTEIVLVGGGHAHVHVLTAFAMHPEPRVRLTLVTTDLATPYSGMLPGVIAGLYTPDEAHIDLARLAAATGTRLIHATACGLDRAAKRVLLVGRPPIAYDLLSIDVGITPALAAIAGAQMHAIAVKPIGSFLAKLDALIERCRAPDGPRRIAVVGGGAGGVELMLSVRSRLLADAQMQGWNAANLSFVLVTDGEI